MFEYGIYMAVDTVNKEVESWVTYVAHFPQVPAEPMCTDIVERLPAEASLFLPGKATAPVLHWSALLFRRWGGVESIELGTGGDGTERIWVWVGFPCEDLQSPPS